MGSAEEARQYMLSGAEFARSAAVKIAQAIQVAEEAVGYFNSAHAEDLNAVMERLVLTGEAATAEFGPNIQQLRVKISELQERVQSLRQPGEEIQGQLSNTAEQMTDYSARYA